MIIFSKTAPYAGEMDDGQFILWFISNISLLWVILLFKNFISNISLLAAYALGCH